MFSKLLKYDFINTRRYGLPLLFSILGTGILGAGFSFLFNRSLSAGRIPSCIRRFFDRFQCIFIYAVHFCPICSVRADDGFYDGAFL